MHLLHGEMRAGRQLHHTRNLKIQTFNISLPHILLHTLEALTTIMISVANINMCMVQVGIE